MPLQSSPPLQFRPRVGRLEISYPSCGGECWVWKALDRFASVELLVSDRSVIRLNKGPFISITRDQARQCRGLLEWWTEEWMAGTVEGDVCGVAGTDWTKPAFFDDGTSNVVDLRAWTFRDQGSPLG